MEESSLIFRSIDGVALDATVVRVPEPQGSVLMIHGMTATKDEGGMYSRLAQALASEAVDSLRFSFRGHGQSGGEQTSATIAGEMGDLLAAIMQWRELGGTNLNVVASSFGAVALLALSSVTDLRMNRLVLWNPVLDLCHTFLEPGLPWGRKNFGMERVRESFSSGWLSNDGFRLSAALFAEMPHYDIQAYFAALPTPSLVIHGSDDSYVSFEIAQRAATANPQATFIAIPNADHGFDRPDEEQTAIRETVSFLTSATV